jgi:hypothetical protein
MADKNVNDDEELDAGSVQKGASYTKGESGKKAPAKPRPPKGLTVDQFTPDGLFHRDGGWAVFEYPSPEEMEPSIDKVREHVEDRVRRAGYNVDGDVVAYNKDDESFRVAVRYS